MPFSHPAFSFATFHEKSLSLSHFYEIGDIEYVTSVLKNHLLRSCCHFIRPWCDEPHRWDHQHGLSFGHFLNICATVWHSALSLSQQVLPLTSSSEFTWEKHFRPTESRSHYKVPLSVPLYLNLSSEKHLMTDLLLLQICPSHKGEIILKNNMTHSVKKYGLGKPFTEHVYQVKSSRWMRKRKTFRV